MQCHHCEADALFDVLLFVNIVLLKQVNRCSSLGLDDDPVFVCNGIFLRLMHFFVCSHLRTVVLKHFDRCAQLPDDQLPPSTMQDISHIFS